MSHYFNVIFTALTKSGCQIIQRLGKAAARPLSGLDCTLSSASPTAADGGSGSLSTTGADIMKLPIGKYVEVGFILCVESIHIIGDVINNTVAACWATANLFMIPIFSILSSFLFLKDCDWVTWLSREKSSYWKNKVAWVTGASSGIGASLARSLAKRGVPVIISGRSAASLENIKASIVSLGYLKEEDIMVLPIELCDLDSIPTAVQNAIAFKGQVNMLFNNAGMLINEILSGWEVSEDLLRVNLAAPIRLSQCLIPHMLTLASSNCPSDCHIVFTNSVHGMIPMAGRAMYATSKHGLSAYANSLAGELAFKVLEHTPTASFTTSAIPIEKSTKAALNSFGESHSKLKDGSTCKPITASAVKCGILSSVSAYVCSLNSKFKNTKLVIPRDIGDVSVTTIYPGYVATQLSAKRIDTEHPRTPMLHNNGGANIGTGIPDRNLFLEHRRAMSSERVAELSLKAVSNKIRNVWIAKMPDMAFLYTHFYAPESMLALYRFIEIYVCKRVRASENSQR